MPTTKDRAVVVIGAGFAGLSAAWDLARHGIPVTILESDTILGGLAGGYDVGGEILEKFYHHWFTSDVDIMEIIEALGLSDRIVQHESRTGLYYANSIFRLSRPLDVLRFTPLSVFGRIRLGLLVLLARRVRNWRLLETTTARDWLIRLGGREVYEVVWEPLLRGKFGNLADQISAVWFWNKLYLRGSSRGKSGKEVLTYFRGGFMSLANKMAADIEKRGGRVFTGVKATGLEVADGRVTAVVTEQGRFPCEAVVATPALPIIADIMGRHVKADYADGLRKIKYLANLCLVLEISRSLSDTYWMNVNDPSFPFVGIIEHTNFEDSKTYGGRHIVYLSKYLPDDHALYRMSDHEVVEYAIPYIMRMFPDFDPKWILKHNVWRADYAQPVVGLRYSDLIPNVETPLKGVYIATMAQVYPEDRGTNAAVRQGRALARRLAANLEKSNP